MKVQFDKSQYSTVGRSSCLVHVQWIKNSELVIVQATVVALTVAVQDIAF